MFAMVRPCGYQRKDALPFPLLFFPKEENRGQRVHDASRHLGSRRHRETDR
jgi:hypothetical protein